VRRLAQRLERAGARVTTHATAGAGDARRHVAALGRDAVDRLVVVGGDGTLHEVVNARTAPFPWPLAIVPVGTANLVARDAGMPPARGVDATAHAILEGREWKVDLLRTDRGLAVASVGVGLDAEIVLAASEARRGGQGGYLRWLAPIASTFVGHVAPSVDVETDDGRAKGIAVMVQNTRCYGGMFTLCPDARMDDGLLHVFVIRKGRPRDWFRMVLDAYRGAAARSRDVSVFRARRVDVRSTPDAAVQLDGDPAGTTPLSMDVLPGALTLLRADPPERRRGSR
jgi:YegS/Rv2252/BmrU family lipid kinase